eukprot:TRINITY_DN780127_c0_g1_i1.p1 TRINITY_DN780127_c0_g1~~TRINITY_DN780127_c0_g1_i1.p1  ORF type:complete len:273 (+),score=59.73 TRINITY_DN780127_c0_g1_i1:103-921(+)
MQSERCDRCHQEVSTVFYSSCNHKFCKTCKITNESKGKECPSCSAQSIEYFVKDREAREVDKENKVRQRVLKVYDRPKRYFPNTPLYYDHLEEIEFIIENLLTEEDTSKLEMDMAKYLKTHSEEIEQIHRQRTMDEYTETVEAEKLERESNERKERSRKEHLEELRRQEIENKQKTGRILRDSEEEIAAIGKLRKQEPKQQQNFIIGTINPWERIKLPSLPNGMLTKRMDRTKVTIINQLPPEERQMMRNTCGFSSNIVASRRQEDVISGLS